MMYLDNASTTKPYPQVIDAIFQNLSTHFANPSSSHTLGRSAATCLEDARKTLLNALGEKGKVYFTSGGTEANNWAIKAALHKNRHLGKHIIATAIEHDSVLALLKQLETQGYELSFLQPDAQGNISLSQLETTLRPDTALVVSMLVNNETGGILPVGDMVKLVRKQSKALFFTDAIQAFCKIPFCPTELGVDFLSVSGHKIHGPRGVAALWVQDKVSITPLLYGGGQESGLRSGTESLHNIVGFTKAVELAKASFAHTSAHLLDLQQYFREHLMVALPTAKLLPQGAPHIVNFSLPGYKSEVLMNFLDAKGIYLSHASACKKGGRSHVLSAMGLAPKIIDGSLRVSFSYETTILELDTLIKALVTAQKTLFQSL